MRKVFPPPSTLLWLAWRQLVTHDKQLGLSFMTWLSVLGVTIGVASLIIVLSVMAGFSSDLQKKLLKGQPHLTLFAKNRSLGLSLNTGILDKIYKNHPTVINQTPFIQNDVVLTHIKHVSTSVLIGLSSDDSQDAWGIHHSLLHGSKKNLKQTFRANSFPRDELIENRSLPGIVLGDKLAYNLSAEIGDVITVMKPQTTLSSIVFTGETKDKKFVVIDKFHSGLSNHDSRWAIVSIIHARQFLSDYTTMFDKINYVSHIAMRLADPYQALETSRKIQKNMPHYQVKTWQEENRSLLFALKLEKFAMGAILMLIVLVAAFSISGTVMMSIFHRGYQISLLRALGMNKRQILAVFVLYGANIGLIGIIVGALIGMGVCWLIASNWLWIPLPSGSFELSYLRIKFLPFDYFVICTIAFLLVLFSAVYPSFVAANNNPTTSLRR